MLWVWRALLTSTYNQSLRRLQDCLTKLANFRFVLQTFWACLTAVQQHFSIAKFNNRHFFHVLKISFAFAFTFLGKKALKQYHVNTKIIFSNPKLLSVKTKICLFCRFSLCPGENFCQTDSCPVALQKLSRRLHNICLRSIM